jgi:hypothetical protein
VGSGCNKRGSDLGVIDATAVEQKEEFAACVVVSGDPITNLMSADVGRGDAEVRLEEVAQCVPKTFAWHESGAR